MHDLNDTVNLEFPRSLAEHFFAPQQPQFQVRLGAATHVGNVRLRNEDHHVVIHRSRSAEILFTNLPQGKLALPVDDAYCLLVADGVGGAAFGDFASQLALNTILEIAGRATSWLMKFTNIDAVDFRQRVNAYLEEIQNRFRQCILDNPRRQGMGTTLTAAYLILPHALLVHIGDSRAYLFRDGELLQLTRDQTLAQDMVDKGIPPERVRKFAHLLTNYLGGDVEHVEADVHHLELRAGDRLLLCTDGLSNMVDEPAIVKVLEELEPQAACDQLVQLALEHGGRDNITVALCDLQDSIHSSTGPSTTS